MIVADAENHLTKSNTLIHIKTLGKLGIEGKLPHLDKEHPQKSYS